MAKQAEVKAAQARARRLLRDNGVEELPVPVEWLAEELGARISYRPLDGDISGILYRQEEGSAVIGVNALDSGLRQRFTVAHEIGHLLLHDHAVIVDKLVKVNFRRTASMPVAEQSQEQEANAFAAELLMPERSVKEAAKKIVGDSPLFSSDDLITHLADTFQVSRQSMSYRLVNLALLDSLAIEG